MKVLRYLATVAIICGFTGLANADPIDFHIGVLDPPITGQFIENTAPFAVTFGACPSSITADGCFALYNDTHETITSLHLTFTNSESDTSPDDFVNYLNGQPAACDTPAGGFFASASCSLSSDESTYTLDFFGGPGIAPDLTGLLAETGPTPEAFGTGTGAVTLTPEPSSILLLSTGVLLAGFFFAKQRRPTTGRSLLW